MSNDDTWYEIGQRIFPAYHKYAHHHIQYQVRLTTDNDLKPIGIEMRIISTAWPGDQRILFRPQDKPKKFVLEIKEE